VSVSRLELADATARPVAAAFRSGALAEQLTGRVWPAAENRVVLLELHH
jgi:hypothetical protein